MSKSIIGVHQRRPSEFCAFMKRKHYAFIDTADAFQRAKPWQNKMGSSGFRAVLHEHTEMGVRNV